MVKFICVIYQELMVTFKQNDSCRSRRRDCAERSP